MKSTARRTRKPVARTLNFRRFATGTAILSIRMGLAFPTDYGFTPIESQIGGHGYELAKRDDSGEVYHVRVVSRSEATCDCKGHTRHGHCKHSDALLKLVEIGRLPAPFEQPQAA